MTYPGQKWPMPKPKRHHGRPSNAEYAAEEAADFRLALRVVMAEHGHLEGGEAEKALAEYRERVGPFEEAAAALDERIGRDLREGVKPSRVLRQ